MKFYKRKAQDFTKIIIFLESQSRVYTLDWDSQHETQT